MHVGLIEFCVKRGGENNGPKVENTVLLEDKKGEKKQTCITLTIKSSVWFGDIFNFT